MKLNITTKGNLEIDDARIIFRNFEGRADTYNKKGDRNFSLVIPTEELAEELIAEGWNVKIKSPRDGYDTPSMRLPVKVSFNEETGRGPKVILKSGRNIRHLDAESVSMLDTISIQSVDMDIRPYDWNINGKTGRTAYLQAIWVTQKIDRFDYRLEEEEE